MLALSTGLALAGCATGLGNTGYPGGSAYPGSSDGYGGQYGGEYGGEYGGQYGGQYGSQRIVATVQDVDPRYGRMLVSMNQSRGYRSSQVEVFFDNNTRLYYQGRVYPVTGLERGDQIAIDAVQSSGRLWARRIEVVRNVRDSGGGYRY